MTYRVQTSYTSRMETIRYIPIKGEGMHTYIFRVELIQEEDGRWSARVPSLRGCATCGDSKEEALQNIRDAADIYVSDMQKMGEEISKDATT